MPVFDHFGAAAPFLRALALTSVAVLWTLLLARLVGLRSFSKMTAFDFAATVATGSLVAQAGTRSQWPDFWQAMAAIGTVFVVQWALARGRQASPRFSDLVDNRATLLLENGRFHDAALRTTRVAKSSLLEKIRMSDAGSIEEVRAIVLEKTGDVSVMTADTIDPELLANVRRIE